MATLGVNVTTGSIGPSAPPTLAYSNLFAVIQSPWGQDNVVTACSSFADFLRNFGGLNKQVTLAADGSADTWGTETTDSVVQGYYAVKGFFDERLGASNGVAYICRVTQTGSPPTAASRTFADGAGHNTTITSKWKGAGGGTVTVTIGTSPKGSAYERFTIAFSQANITEYWDISNATDAADASRRSQLVTITLPGGGQLPSAVSSPQKLGNGTPGTADAYGASSADLNGAISAAGVKTGLQVFTDYRLGSGFVVMPGHYSSTDRTNVGSHVATYNRTGILGTTTGLNLTSVVADLGSTAGNNLYYTWPPLKVPDQNSDSGGTLMIDPVGHYAGLFARMDNEYNGPHKSPAGLTHPFVSVLDVERTSSGAELCDESGSNALADSFINTTRVKGIPQRLCGWGLRSLATDSRYRQINISRVVQLVRATCYLIAEPYTFEPIDPDGNLFSKVRADIGAFLFGLRTNGALFGDFPGSAPKPTDAYAVICDRGNNPDVLLAAGQLTIDIYIIPTPNAERVQINLLVGSPGTVRGV